MSNIYLRQFNVVITAKPYLQMITVNYLSELIQWLEWWLFWLAMSFEKDFRMSEREKQWCQKKTTVVWMKSRLFCSLNLKSRVALIQVFWKHSIENITEKIYIYSLTFKAAIFSWAVTQCICRVETQSEKNSSLMLIYSCKPHAFIWRTEEASE